MQEHKRAIALKPLCTESKGKLWLWESVGHFYIFLGLGVQVKKVCLGNLGLCQAKVDPGLGGLLFWKADHSSTLWLETS